MWGPPLNGCPTLRESENGALSIRHEAERIVSIDGVLLRSSSPLPHAHQVLTRLQRESIPFILLTNGGGKTEASRVAELSRLLSVPISSDMFIQSHTPFADLVDQVDPKDETRTPLKDKTILVIGGVEDHCKKVAESYGFKHVLTPANILASEPNIYPLSTPSFLQSLSTIPPALSPYNPHSSHPPPSLSSNPQPHLRIASTFVYHDPTNWSLDTQLLLDLLLSHAGYLGTTSSLLNNPSLPNRGYQQDSQPPLYFSNPDLHYATTYHLPRLGQGGFRTAFEGVYAAVTGGAKLHYTLSGKPSQSTFAFTEARLEQHRRQRTSTSSSSSSPPPLKRVYMIGDNPESDIRGGNEYRSSRGTKWHTILVRSGVYDDDNGQSKKLPAYKPDVTVDGVSDAVEWALAREGARASETASEPISE
ncbi:MAG: hypothetical protein Q9190_001687 [Brigantiaea leucoxantha]